MGSRDFPWGCRGFLLGSYWFEGPELGIANFFIVFGAGKNF